MYNAVPPAAVSSQTSSGFRMIPPTAPGRPARSSVGPEPGGEPFVPRTIAIAPFGVGDDVGLGDGRSAGDGSPALATGEAAGFALGRGLRDGFGVATAFRVGFGVGLAVGFGVGLAVGFGVGLAVGTGVGFGVGVGVGFGVGVAVATTKVPVGVSHQ